MNTLGTIPLSDQSRMLLGIANSSDEVFFITNAKRQLIFVNRSLCEKSSYNPQDLIGKSMTRLYSSRIRVKRHAVITRAIQRQGQWSGEIEFQKTDGTPFPIIASLIAYHDMDDRFSGIVGIGRDIRESYILRHSHWQSESTLRTAIEAMGDAFILSDSAGNILLSNAALCTMVGYPMEEMETIGFPYPWIDEPESIQKIRRLVKRVHKEGCLRNVTMGWKTKEGKRLRVNCTLAPCSYSPGGTTGIIMTIRDVTDIQYADELRRADERMHMLISDVRRKAERLQTLEEINWLVLKNSNATKVFTSIIGAIKKLVEHDLAGIYVLNPKKKILIPHTLSKQTAFSRKLAKFSLPLGEGIVGEAAATGRMVVVNNAQRDPRSRYPEGMKPDKEHFIAVPLRARSNPFGILVVSRNRDPEFIEEEALIVKSFAEAATVALENLRLSSSLRVRSKELLSLAFTGATAAFPSPVRRPMKDRSKNDER